MTILEIVFLLLLIIIFTIFAITVFYLFRFSMIILKVQDSLEECIENLEQRQQAISKILEIPLFFDSPEIRRVLEEIKASKNEIINVAQVLGKIEEIKEE